MMSKDDLYQLGSVLAELGTGSIQCAGPSTKTTENLAKASGRPVIYNAIAPEVDQHGQPKGNHEVMCQWLRDCNEKKGLRIFGQAIVSSGGDQVALKFTDTGTTMPYYFNPETKETETKLPPGVVPVSLSFTLKEAEELKPKAVAFDEAVMDDS